MTSKQQKIDTSIEGLTQVYTPKKKVQKKNPSPTPPQAVKTVQIRQVNVQKLPTNPPITTISDSPNESESDETTTEIKETPFELELIPVPKKKTPDLEFEKIQEEEPEKTKLTKGHLEKNGDGYYVEDEEDLEQIEGLNHRSLWIKLLEICRRIYREMGTGHTESIYHHALEIELRNHQISYESEKRVLITYQDVNHGRTYTLGEERLDLFLLDYNLIIEMKAVTNQPREMELAQIRKYYRELLKAGNHLEEWGLIINFPQPGPTKKARDLVDFVIVRL